ncbi:SGNH/GDSL hydrolase family protein [Cupriavidus sp. D39]|uniref:SGNH/GDSL hydrolase family protein n=1 Tax=Cupriavidus sp. D39 TaxID=2997877 RepID=UPI00226E8E27|nr:SGNH/GDSL hydrolase family protein [Cupriavidus sp. D39]MCY0854356.1 SGNH/GDSL hydrolase family protein [Cupriavidus sp. D39]
MNRAGNAINNCTALVGVTETAATDTTNNTAQVVIGGIPYPQLAPAGSIAGWRPVTWGGASSVNIPSAASASQYAVSDWIPLSSIPRADGGTRPLIMVRTQHDGSVDGNFAFLGGPGLTNNRTPSSANRGRFTQFTGSTTGVSNPAAVGSLTGNSFEVFPVFRYRAAALSVMVSGDSTEQNDALVAAGFTSWGYRGCADVSTQSRPINYLNCGCSGKNSNEYWARTQELISAGVVPNVLVIGPASVNDVYSNLDRSFESHRARALEIIEFCNSKGINYLCFIPLLPFNSNNAQQDGYRVAFNSYLQTLAAANPGCSALTFPGLGDGAMPERWVPANNYGGDGTHPTEGAIDTIMAPSLAGYLRSIP